MTELSARIKALAGLGNYILTFPQELKDIMNISKSHNQWFDIQSQTTALTAIANEFLNEEILAAFTQKYNVSKQAIQPKTVAIVMAGNIPLVGFHDLLCVVLSGNKALVKLSSKDNKLMRAIIMKLYQLEPSFKEQIIITEQNISGFEAVIATGSDTSAKYFEEYFSKYPHIIRKNRNSVAILTGNETAEELQALGKDVFQFYGLGCRNVSKVFVPKDYKFDALMENLNEYKEVANNTKYKNNFDYNLTLLILNKIPYYENDCVLVTEDASLHSRIGTLHYQEYDNMDTVNNWIIEHKDALQVVVGKEHTPFGTAQTPTIYDYADNVDTMEFLLKL